MKSIGVFTMIAVVSILAGCSNPFLTHYDGQKFPRTTTATRIMSSPDATAMDLIGTATFATATAPDAGQAVAAAEAVGADQVEWDRSFQGSSTTLELKPIFGPYTSGSAWVEGGAMVDVEQPVTERWYRYHARFYRRKVAP